jgi:mannose-6-phosphate isomerase-like protein (cupin superfamily)
VGQIVYIDSADDEWQRSLSNSQQTADGAYPTYKKLRYKSLDTGVPGVPTVQLVEYEPGHEEPAHSHAGSEMLFVLDGEAAIGDRVVQAGTLVYIEGGTTYGPIKGGPDGMRFVRVDLPQ